MSSIRKSINGALKMLGVVGGHGASATNQELADALDTLFGMYHQFITNGSLGRMMDVSPTGDYVVGENQRVFRRANTDQVIKLPDAVSSCGSIGYCIDDIARWKADQPQNLPTTDYGRFPTRQRIYSGKRAIRDLSVVVINDSLSGNTDEAIYDSQQKKWFVISEFDHEFDFEDENDVTYFNSIMDSEAPLSRRDYNGFRSWLAVNLADIFGAEISPTIQRNAYNYESNIATRLAEPYNADDSVEFGKIEVVEINKPPVAPVETNVLIVDRAGDTYINIDMTGVDLTGTVLEFIVPDVSITIVPVTNVSKPDDQVIRFTPALAQKLGEVSRQWVLRRNDNGVLTVLGQGYIKAVGIAVKGI